jgi:hypothetical protein
MSIDRRHHCNVRRGEIVRDLLLIHRGTLLAALAGLL